MLTGSCFEFFVFDEEVLLMLCFITFCDLSYTFLGKSIFENLSSGPILMKHEFMERFDSVRATIFDNLQANKVENKALTTRYYDFPICLGIIHL